jgi:toxin YoeB
MKVVFHGEGWDHYQFWIDTDKARLTKLNRLIDECRRHPFEGTGKPEPLKGNYAGHWSRRMDREHRLVYRVEGDSLIIVQCRYHYTV